MFDSVFNVKFAGLITALVASLIFTSGAANAGSCQGVVSGLSKTYNLKKGSGFLALRAKPTARSKMRTQLFNGDVVDVDRRRGNWIYVYSERGSGWAFAKYVRRGCDGI